MTTPRDDAIQMDASQLGFKGSGVSRAYVRKVREILKANPGQVLKGKRGEDGSMEYTVTRKGAASFRRTGPRELASLKAHARFRKVVLTGDHPEDSAA